MPPETLPVDPDAEPPPSPRRARPSFRRTARRRQWDILAAIAVGGGIGSVARYGLAQAWPTPPGGFPWATFATNVSGSFLLGLLMVYVLDVWPPTRYARPFLGVGVLGGFTTFSTYTVELRGLLAAGHWSLTDAYALTSLIAGLGAVWTGIAAARRAARLPVRRGPSRRSRSAASAVPRPTSSKGRAR
ncbi:fluoride efflux transporter FluC [Peterkaempfera bronchialis]|uniref:fluoride efflux transporter FluC n=1 Tax=Peterkaempfera bronchialis TaxID=2126346 RepID=UPI003C2FD2A2